MAVRSRTSNSRTRPQPDALLIGLGAALAAAGAAEQRASADLAALQRTWQRETDTAVKRWIAEIQPLQVAAAERQIELYMGISDPVSLASLTLPVLGVDLLDAPMRTLAAAGAAAVVREAAAQGVTLPDPPPLAAIGLGTWARAAAQRLAVVLAGSVAAAALQLWRPGATPAAVTDGVRTHVAELSDRGPRDVIGGALTQAQNLGRLQVYSMPLPAGATLQLVADETLDSNTCKPCQQIDGTVLPTPEAAALAYGGAGYLFCKGGPRCRGTVRGVWAQSDPQRDAFETLRGGLAALRPDA